MPGKKKKVPERRSGLRPSEEELPERRSITKIPLKITYDSIPSITKQTQTHITMTSTLLLKYC
jgi:hypothetical protein